MKLRHAERAAAERIRLLEMEATLQRTQLAAAFAQWESRKSLARGTTLAGWGFRLFATSLIARLRGRRSR